MKALGIILILSLVTGLGGIVASYDRPPIGEAPPIENSTISGPTAESQSEQPRPYTVIARSPKSLDAEQLAKYGQVGTQTGKRIEITMSPSAVNSVKKISWVTDVRPVLRPQPNSIPGSSNGSSLGVSSIHKDGVTGKGVRVGIIDGGFDTNNSAIAANIAHTKSFRQTQGSPDHGTSVAETVVRTAPDSQLYLATIATGTDDEAAINYLSQQGVDIIVHSLGFPALEDDGTNFLSDDINNATQNGTLFVTSAGNDAQVHWEGKFRDTNSDNIHEWDPNGDELNCLQNCSAEYSGGIRVYVRWDDRQARSQYRPALYNAKKGKYIKLGRDRVFTTPTGSQYAVLSTKVPSQPVDLVVAHTAGPADDEIEVLLVGPTKIEHYVPNSSIGAPGDVPKAFTAAAYKRGINDRSTQIAAYSSRGRTDDGRIGIDAAGYTNIRLTSGFYDPFGGTSAAAPYIGGVAALIHQNHPVDPSPRKLTNILKSSSDDIRLSGYDTASGSGVINATDAMLNQNFNQVVTLNDTQQTATTGSTTTYEVVLTEAPNGVSRYSFNISINDSNIATNTNFSFGGTPRQTTQQLKYGPANATVSVTGERVGIDPASNVTLGTVTARGKSTNSTLIGVQIQSLQNRNNATITANVRNGMLTVVSGIGDLTGNRQAATDPDSDGVYEDINGDGSADLRDLQPYFNLVKPGSGSLSNPGLVDFNGDRKATLRDLKPFFSEIKP